MSIRVGRAVLLSELESVYAGLSPKEIVEQSSCFAFRKGKVHTFNDEVSCNTSSCLGSEITGAVKADPLLNILRKLDEDELEIEQQDGELILQGKRRQAGIRLEKEITLPIKVVEKPGEWLDLHKDFAEAINIAKQCTSNDEAQFKLTCVHIHPKWVEACDNFQICRWKMKTGIQQATLVRQSAIKHITSLGMIKFSETPSWLHFQNSNGLVYSCRRYLDEYVDLSRFLEVEGEEISLPKSISDAVERSEIFSVDNTDNNMVLIDLSPGKLRIKGQGISGWYSERRKIKYTGPAISFMVAPKLLTELVKQHNDYIISKDKLKVNGVGKYVYVACLAIPSDGKKKKDEDSSDDE